MVKKAWICGALLFAAAGAHSAVDVKALAAAGASPETVILALMVEDGMSMDDAIQSAGAADPSNRAAYAKARAKVKASQAALALATGAGTSGLTPGGAGGGTSGGGGGSAVADAVNIIVGGTPN